MFQEGWLDVKWGLERVINHSKLKRNLEITELTFIVQKAFWNPNYKCYLFSLIYFNFSSASTKLKYMLSYLTPINW